MTTQGNRQGFRFTPGFQLPAIFALLLMLVSTARADSITSVQSGLWSDPATWDVGVPASTDDVTIARTHIITLDIGPIVANAFTIERNGELRTEDAPDGIDGTPGGDSADILVTTTGDILVFGRIVTGNGGSGGDHSVLTPAGISSLAQAGSGGKSGDLDLISNTGSIRINVTALIRIGQGGAGGIATANTDPADPDTDGADAEAQGGPGGIGGSLTLTCPNGNLSIAPVTGIIQIGSAGGGGDSIALGGFGGDAFSGTIPGVGGGATAGGGHGGSSGTLMITSATFQGGTPTPSEARAELLDLLSGGQGGAPGTDSAQAGPNGTPQASLNLALECWDTLGRDAKEVRVGPTHGGSSLLAPTNGADAFASATTGVGTGRGGSSLAIGGNGGDSYVIQVLVGAGAIGISLVDTIARGGDATATAGTGGPIGGDGGDAIATGGDAGFYPLQGTANLCGRGGNGSATGGSGSAGASCCGDPVDQGQDGGAGGMATATGGDANNQAANNCAGGSATTRPGNGGDAGLGAPPGERGLRGDRNATAGQGQPDGSIINLGASHGQVAERCKRYFLRVVGPASATIDGEWLLDSSTADFTGPNILPQFGQAFIPMPSTGVLGARIVLGYPDGTDTELLCVAFDPTGEETLPLNTFIDSEGGFGPTMTLPDIDGPEAYVGCDLTSRLAGIQAHTDLEDLGGVRVVTGGVHPILPGTVFGQTAILVDFNAQDLMNPAPLTGTLNEDAFCQLVEECNVGNVNAGAGERRPSGATERVLRINNQTSVSTLYTGVPISITMDTPSAGPVSQAKYVLWVWPGRPDTRYQLSAQGISLGCTVGATPFQRPLSPQPIYCLRSSGMPAIVCQGVPELGGPGTAPFALKRPGGILGNATFTMQGLIKDDMSANATGFSVTNAVILTTRIFDLELQTAEVTGTRPIDSATADFDEDGAFDLAVLNTSSDDLSILLGSGSGAFVSSQTLSAGDEPTSLITADFNGDTHADLALTSAGTDEVILYLGDGLGGFTNNGSYGVGDHPSDIATGDVDGDLILDLLITNRDSDTVSILLGDGLGSFLPGVDFSAGDLEAAPEAIAVGQFNDDTFLDVAIANAGSNDVALFLGLGTGFFTPDAVVAVGQSPRDVTADDVNGDGLADVIVANAISDDLSVLVSTNGPGTVFEAPVTIAAGTEPSRIVLADLDLNGHLDIVLANGSGDAISVLLGDGTACFGAEQTFVVGSGPRGLSIADYDLDGDADLAVSLSVTNNVSPLLNLTLNP